MSRRLRFVARVLVFALAIPLITFFAEPSIARTAPKTLFHQAPVTAAPVEPGFPIDYVSVTFELAPEADVHHDHGPNDEHGGTAALAVRFRKAGVWASWQRILEDGAQAEGQWAGALVAGDDADAYQIRGLPAFARDARGGAVNTTDGPDVVVGIQRADAAAAATSCKSRADWKADESLRTSTRSYAPIQVLTVHHTATENDDPDPDARVRAIYTYHVRNNRWDDIGYQALISEAGAVYEGRWSGSDSTSCLAAAGTGSDFGHETADATSPIVTGAHTGGYNTGNFGIALLGTFTDSVAPKAAARTALVEYLAELADRHGIDPRAVIRYDNGTNAKDVKAISGHRDFVSTECPGGLLYADLPKIRDDVAAALAPAALTATITAPADASAHTVRTAGSTADVTFGAEAAGTTEPVRWAWTVDGATVATTSATFTTSLAVGEHTVEATATAESATARDTIVVTVAPPTIDVAYAERTVRGTKSGTYADTQTGDGVVEKVTEVESGGKVSKRYSYLEHRWNVHVTGGATVTLRITASATASGDGDAFRFDWSRDGGSSWSQGPRLVAGSSGTLSHALPSGLQGEILIRVIDTNRKSGTRSLDTVAVDHLLVQSL